MGRFVLYILCPSRSGSTLLGNVLGGHPQLMHIGEVVAPVRKGRPVRCRICRDEPCPLWGGVLTASYVRQAVARFGGAEVGPGPGDLHARILDASPDLAGLVDSSKKLAWARYHASSQTQRFLFLRRDLRGCLASWKRTAPDRLARTVDSVARQIEALEAFRTELPSGTARVVRYEELVSDPGAVASAVVHWLGLPTAEGLEHHTAHDNHLIGGNPGPTHQRVAASGRDRGGIESEMDPQQLAFYRSATATFVRDERWRTELDASDLELFGATLARCNEAWGYG